MQRSLGALALVTGLAFVLSGSADAQRGPAPRAGQGGAERGQRERGPTKRKPAPTRGPQGERGRGEAPPETASPVPGPTEAGADDDATGTEVPDGKLRAWFGSIDSDGNSWLSLRETASGLDFDAGRFRSFDIDKDGRMTIAEYRDFCVRVIESGHRIDAPRSALAGRRETPRRDELQLRVAFDRDLDGAIDLREFGTLLVEYEQGDLESRLVFQRADANGDQRLDLAELTRVAVFLDPLAQSQNRAAPPTARTLSDLFAERVERGGEGQPPFIAGPVPTFWRLDVDGDGFIEDEDLAILQGRTHMPISVAAVKSALDRDGDGRLSALEFAMALDSNVKPESPAPAR